MRVALIGCGAMGIQAHLPTFQVEGHTIVAGADPSPERLAVFRDATGLDEADCSTDPFEVLSRRDLDAVIVATPPAYRPKLVIGALEAGKHVLAEKPIAMTPAEGWQMVGAARAAGRQLAVVHNYIHRQDYATVKRVLGSGVIGQPYVITQNFLGVREGRSTAAYYPSWRHDARVSGGGVLIDMVHAVYLSAWLMGEPIRAVNAALAQRREDNVEDVALCRFEFESGFGLVNMAWGFGPGGLEIMGTEGRLMLFYRHFGTCPFMPPEQLHVYRGQERVSVDDSFLQLEWPQQPADPAYPLRGIARNFARAIDGLEQLIAPGEHGCLALEAVVGAYASAARQRTVRLPLDPDDSVYQHGIQALLEDKVAAAV